MGSQAEGPCPGLQCVKPRRVERVQPPEELAIGRRPDQEHQRHGSPGLGLVFPAKKEAHAGLAAFRASEFVDEIRKARQMLRAKPIDNLPQFMLSRWAYGLCADRGRCLRLDAWTTPYVRLCRSLDPSINSDSQPGLTPDVEAIWSSDKRVLIFPLSSPIAFIALSISQLRTGMGMGSTTR
jgi:hypothetical protein